jgi:hypothetical protein
LWTKCALRDDTVGAVVDLNNVMVVIEEALV